MTIRTCVPAFGVLFAATMALGGQLQQPAGPMQEVVPATAPTATQTDAPAAPATPAATTPAPSVPAPSKSGEPELTKRPPDTPAVSGAKIEVPVGTHLPLVLHNAISTRSAKPGDPVYFETVFPVMVDGKVAIPAGSYVSGEVSQSKRAGKVKGKAQLAVRLTTMILPNAYEVNLAAAPSNAGTGGGETTNKEGTIVGDSDKTTDVGTVIRTTAAGTAIGAGVGEATGNLGKGVGIGAGAGAAAGLMAVLLSRGPDAELPRGTTLEAVLDRPIMLDADKVQFTTPGTSTALSGPPNREPQRQKLPF
jgi:type IV secretion system protein VirB10